MCGDSHGKGNNEVIKKDGGQSIADLIGYFSNSILCTTILKKTTGHVIISSFDKGESFTEKISPFDSFIQIIEGKAEIIIHKKSNILFSGQGIIIPAHAPNIIRAPGRFKMLQTIIKSGYEL